MKRESLCSRLRQTTPGCAEVAHFNNAGASLMDERVWEAANAYRQEEFRSGGYETQSKWADDLANLAKNAARAFGGSAESWAYLTSASRAFAVALWSLDWAKGERVLVCESVYSANYLTLLELRRRLGIELEWIPKDAAGHLNLGQLEIRLRERPPRLFLLTHIGTAGGNVADVAACGALLREHCPEALFWIDGAQSAGQIPVNVDHMGCDVFFTTGRKYLRGPRGSALLYSSERALGQSHTIFPDLASAVWESPDSFSHEPGAKVFETWERDHGAMIGLSRALECLLEVGAAPLQQAIAELAQRVREELQTFSTCHVVPEGEGTGLVLFSWNGREVELQQHLLKAGVNLGMSHKRHSWFQLERYGVERLLRVSVHGYNSEEEVTRLVRQLRQFAEG